jgi:hypothetical protein
MAIILADSEFNLTLFAQEQVWSRDVSLGEGIRSLWTGTACVATVPGRRFGIPLEQCTREQFLEEVQSQLFACESLDQLIQKANRGRRLKSFRIARIEVWHEWIFSPRGIIPLQPKWVNTTETQQFQPDQATPVSNLVLAGAHTKTAADVWSIEAAAESGRRAAKLIDPRVNVLSQYRPIWLRGLSALDDLLYSIKAPHVMDVLMLVAVAAVFLWIATIVVGYTR